MKPLNQQELRTFARTVTPLLEGAQLQEVLTNDQGLALGFYRDRMLWVLVDFKPAAPMILFFENAPPFRKSPRGKPVGLFLSSHGENKRLRSLRVLEQWGRVLLLELEGREETCEIEIHLIPKQMNLIVRAAEKTISWEKQKALKEAPTEIEREERSFEDIHREWMKENQRAPAVGEDPQARWEKQRQRDLQKKRKALEEIQNKIAEDRAASWRSLGDQLKTHGWQGLSSADAELVAREKGLSWNIENAFQKAKQLEQKRAGTEERALILQEEIDALERAVYRPQPRVSAADDLMKKSEARGRKLNLRDGVTAYIGRSAADNLALLRQAKAWDYWLHLRDYPGAHALVHRQKNQEIPREELMRVAQWVARESLSAKTLSLGQKLGVVYVECRFVKPIKGDKTGRVTYHSEKNLVVGFDPEK